MLCAVHAKLTSACGLASPGRYTAKQPSGCPSWLLFPAHQPAPVACPSHLQDVRQGRCLHHLQVDAPLMSCTLLGEEGSVSGGRQCLVAAGADGGVHFVDCTSGEQALGKTGC